MAATNVTAKTFADALMYAIGTTAQKDRVERVKDCVQEFFVEEALAGRTYAAYKKARLRAVLLQFIEDGGLTAALQGWLQKHHHVNAVGDGIGHFAAAQGEQVHVEPDQKVQRDISFSAAARRAKRASAVARLRGGGLFDLF